MRKLLKEPGRIERHVRSRLVSGLFVIVPLWITYLVLEMLFHAMASLMVPILDDLPFFKDRSDQTLALMAVGIFLVAVYVIGTISAFMMGRRLVAVGEGLIMKIPIVKSIYSAARQVVDTFSISDKEQFKSVVLVDFLRPGMFVIGFVTGVVADNTGRKLYKVFVPHAPNPTGGFLLLLEEKELIPTSLSVEDGFKMIVSGGVISPDLIEIKKSTEATQKETNLGNRQ